MTSGILGSMVCERSDELGIQYLMALDKVRRAQTDLCRAVTQTNIECATTELMRVEAYRLALLRELAGHCESHGCFTPELKQMCGNTGALEGVAA